MSAIFFDILMCAMEEDVVVHTKPSFYKHYVDDTYIHGKIISSELHRAIQIAMDFDKELRRIKTKVLHAGYPAKFINETFLRFNEEKEKLNTKIFI